MNTSLRAASLNAFASDYFDLVVIGGGVTGCGIALDAAARGLKTALIEKGDFASGTSSKSTKLIHGGLRYLKQLEFGLVRETGTERAVVNKIAPHLCLPEKMLLPITEDGSFGKYSSSLGLWVYDFLANVEKEDRRKMLSKEEALEKEPLLEEDTLKGAGYYAEYRTDDARLTIELIKKAIEYGAHAANYCKAEDFVYNNAQQIEGLKCTDMLTGETVHIKARRVVAAAGPWVDHIRKKNDSIKNKKLHLTKGVHLVFPQEKLPVKQSIYFDEPGGRMLFAIPRGRITYLGTTDTNYNGRMDRIVATKEDRDYLINAVNKTFPSINLKAEDVISNWAGLRPLIHEDGKSPSELSRKDEIFEAEDGLISIAGGKLTGYRKMAERIVDLVIQKDGESIAGPIKQVTTDTIPLATDKVISNTDVQKLIDQYAQKVEAKGLPPYYGWYLVTNYGPQAETIVNSLQDKSDEIDLALNELDYCLKYEMVSRLEDFMVRRTGRLYFDIQTIPIIRQAVTDRIAEVLGWSAERIAAENARLDELLFDATTYYDEDLKK